jgi:hypothetical protein
MFDELLGGEVVAELPAVAVEHEEGSHLVTCCDASARYGMVNEVFCSAVPLVWSHMSETRLEDKGGLSQQACARSHGR